MKTDDQFGVFDPLAVSGEIAQGFEQQMKGIFDYCLSTRFLQKSAHFVVEFFGFHAAPLNKPTILAKGEHSANL